MAEVTEVTIKLGPAQVALLNRLIIESATDGERTVASRVALQRHALDDDGESLLSTQPFCDDQEAARNVLHILDEVRHEVWALAQGEHERVPDRGASDD